MPASLKPERSQEMAAVILAAGGGVSLPGSDTIIPRSLLRIGAVTLLERQVRMLGLSGVSPERIAVVAGTEREGWSPDHYDAVRALGVQLVINAAPTPQGSCQSLVLGLQHLGPTTSAVICDGDLVFDRDLIDGILQAPAGNVLALKRAMSISETRGKVRFSGGRIAATNGRVTLEHYPWHVYMGIGRIERDAQIRLVERYAEDPGSVDVLSAVDKLLETHEFRPWLSSGGEEAPPDSSELVGGSFANLECFTVVRKQARGDGRSKLTREIEWLRRVPGEYKAHFPEVLSSSATDEVVSYEMPYYRQPSLRHLLQVGDLDTPGALAVIERILEFLCTSLYSRDRGSAGVDWLVKHHLDRVNRRLFVLGQRSSLFRDLLGAQRIRFNGTDYFNLPFWIAQLGRRRTLLECLAPTRLCDVHGDLHFQNILVDLRKEPASFVLADPRGEIDGFDLFYDVGKLWHSCNGLYDFIHTDQCEVKLEIRGDRARGEVCYSNVAALDTYRGVLRGLPRVVERFALIGGDPAWQMKTRFAEVMHFASVMPFHLRHDGVETRAVALYLTAVRLLDEFCRDYDILTRYPADQLYFNINSSEQYQLALSDSTEF
jgi:choline kinase